MTAHLEHQKFCDDTVNLLQLCPMFHD